MSRERSSPQKIATHSGVSASALSSSRRAASNLSLLPRLTLSGCKPIAAYSWCGYARTVSINSPTRSKSVQNEMTPSTPESAARANIRAWSRASWREARFAPASSRVPTPPSAGAVGECESSGSTGPFLTAKGSARRRGRMLRTRRDERCRQDCTCFPSACASALSSGRGPCPRGHHHDQP